MPEDSQRSRQHCIWRWKRIATIALLLFVGGAIVNIALALACMVFPRVEYPHVTIRNTPTEAEQAWWSRAAPQTSPQRTANRALNGRAFGLQVTEMIGNRRFMRFHGSDGDGVPTIDIRTFYDSVVHLRVGWPLKSFSAERWAHSVAPGDSKPSYGMAPGLRIEGDLEVGGVSIDRAGLFGSPELRIIAYRPILVGFVFNSVFYATMLGIIIWCADGMRRMIRRRRGLCEKCAYPVGIRSVCTECGAPVRPVPR